MTLHGPLFVVGKPRSGTKLLRALLNRHSRIAIPEIETGMLPHLATHWTRFGDLSDRKRFDAFYAWCSRYLYFRNSAYRGASIDADTWYSACREYSLQAVFEALIRHDAGAPAGSDVIWGDKTPSYLMHLPTLRRLFPSARFLHIVRDVRDVCLSAREAWGKSILRSAQRWADDVTATRALTADWGRSYCEIRFEDLVRDPATTMHGVCTFLDLTFDPATTTLERPTERGGIARGQARIVTETVERWRRDLAPKERRSIEMVAGRALRELRYDMPDGLPTQRRLGRVEAGWLAAADSFSLLNRRLVGWGPRDLIRYGYRAWTTPQRD